MSESSASRMGAAASKYEKKSGDSCMSSCGPARERTVHAMRVSWSSHVLHGQQQELQGDLGQPRDQECQRDQQINKARSCCSATTTSMQLLQCTEIVGALPPPPE